VIAQWYSAGLQAGLSRVRVPAVAGNFSFHHRVQTGSASYTATTPCVFIAWYLAKHRGKLTLMFTALNKQKSCSVKFKTIFLSDVSFYIVRLPRLQSNDYSASSISLYNFR
jgi:hypothetical protein